MEADLYALDFDSVERLRQLLQAFEGASRLKYADGQKKQSPVAKIENHIAVTTSSITAISTDVSVLTTLNGGINDTVTTITVADSSGMPNGVSFLIVIDSEEILVTSKSGTFDLIVLRGVNGTSAASHSNGANVSRKRVTLGTGTAVVYNAVQQTDGEYDLESTFEEKTVYNLSADAVDDDTIISVWRDPASGILYHGTLSESAAGAGITSINSETGPAITFAAGSTGTDFAVATGSNTVTYNLPAASATASGKVTTGTQTIAGAKTFTSSVTCTSGSSGSFLNTGGTVSANDGLANSMHFGPGGSIGEVAHALSAGHRLSIRLAPDSTLGSEQRGIWLYSDDTGTGAITNAQPSYGIKDYNGSAFVYHLGGWASVNGLEFKGGLYVSGTISGITSLGTVTAGTWNADVIGLAYGGTGANLSDPGADRILFWDDSGNSVAWLGLEPSLTISGTTLGVSEGAVGVGFESGYLTSAQNIASATMANVTGLSFAIGASEVWEAEFHLVIENNSTNGLSVQLTGPASPTSVTIVVEGPEGTTAPDSEVLTAFSSPTANLYASGGSGSSYLRVRALIRNGSNGGTVQLQAALLVAMGDQDIQVGSYFKASRLG